jgi:hypothetical protein
MPSFATVEALNPSRTQAPRSWVGYVNRSTKEGETYTSVFENRRLGNKIANRSLGGSWFGSQAVLTFLVTSSIKALEFNVNTRGHIAELLEVLTHKVTLREELALESSSHLVVHVVEAVL